MALCANTWTGPHQGPYSLQCALNHCDGHLGFIITWRFQRLLLHTTGHCKPFSSLRVKGPNTLILAFPRLIPPPFVCTFAYN